MSSPFEAANAPAPELALAVRAALLRIARNLLRYQQIEQALKFTLPYMQPVGAGESSISTALGWTRAGVSGQTLGQLHKRLANAVKCTTDTAPGFERGAPTTEDLVERERRVVDDRNRLVHHLDHSHLISVDGCKALIADLDAAHARSDELFTLVSALAASLVHLMSYSEMPDSDDPVAEAADMRRMAAAMFDRLNVQFEPDPAIDAWQDPVATLWNLCSDEWMPLDRVGKLLYAAAPIARERVKASGGFSRWVTTLNFVEIRQAGVDGTPPGRSEIRRIQPPSGTPPSPPATG